MNLDILSSSDSESDQEFAQPRKKVYRPRINFELDDFMSRFRLSKTAIERVIEIVGPDLQHDTDRNCALSPTQQLLLGLRYLTGHGIMLLVGDGHGPSKATVCRAVRRVITAINAHYFAQTIAFPEHCDRTAANFYKFGHMLCVIGAIDGTHIPIQKPTENEEQYVNRHHDHSINAMMVCGPDYRFYYVSSRFPGSVHDARVLSRSNLADRFDHGWRPIPGAILLGDSGYGLSEWLITPILNAQTRAERRFNVSHRKTRSIIECAFGILKRRWACLKHLRLNPVYAAEVIKACTVLHNLSFTEKPITEKEIAEIQRIIDIRVHNVVGDNNLQEEDIEVPNNNASAHRRLELVNHFR